MPAVGRGERFYCEKQRKSNRLPEYDYSAPGAYFVTICCRNRESIFGEIQDGRVILGPIGHVAQASWRVIARHYPFVRTDAFVVMPNHVHGILWILPQSTEGADSVGAYDHTPLQGGSFVSPSRNLGAIVRGYKGAVTGWARRHTSVFEVWQRNYHDRIVRNECELLLLREYIVRNPENWIIDPDHPDLPSR